MYEPGVWAPRISPTPLLMIVASHDTITLTDLALASYERALEPKKLVLIPGGRFDPYRDQFRAAEAAATEWFCEHLVVPETAMSDSHSAEQLSAVTKTRIGHFTQMGHGGNDDCN
jgi:hypothetical protein